MTLYLYWPEIYPPNTAELNLPFDLKGEEKQEFKEKVAEFFSCIASYEEDIEDAPRIN